MTGTLDDVRSAADALAGVTGLRVQLRPSLARRFRVALGEVAPAVPGELVDQVRAGGALRDRLVDATVVTESYFLRDRGHFDFVARLLPELVECHPDRRIRVLSAGCAGGEEAYSLAIVAAEAGVADQVQVVAIDLSHAALARAARGEYRAWSLRGVTPQERRRWFAPTEGGHRVRDRYRRVEFRHGNLADRVPPSAEPFDLILCRNVLLHMTPKGLTRAVTGLEQRLRPGGWLLTAASDPPVATAGLRPQPRVPGLLRRRGEDPPDIPDHLGLPADLSLVSDRSRPRSGAPPVTTGQVADVPGTVAAGPKPAGSTPLAGQGGARGDHAPEFVESEGTSQPGPETAAAVVDRVLDLRGRGRLAEAEETASAGLRRHPEDPELHTALAAVLLEAGRIDEAATAARAAVYLDPGAPMAHLHLGLARQATGASDRARVAFRAARRLLERLPPETPVRLGDGERAARLARLAADHERLAAGTTV